MPLSDGYYMKGNRILGTCTLHDIKRNISVMNIYDWIESDVYIYGKKNSGYYIYDKVNGIFTTYKEEDFEVESIRLGLNYNMNAKNISCYTNR